MTGGWGGGGGVTGVRAAGASTRTGPGRSATCACEGERGEKRGECLIVDPCLTTNGDPGRTTAGQNNRSRLAHSL